MVESGEHRERDTIFQDFQNHIYPAPLAKCLEQACLRLRIFFVRLPY
jgi:hypothetical protein